MGVYDSVVFLTHNATLCLQQGPPTAECFVLPARGRQGMKECQG